MDAGPVIIQRMVRVMAGDDGDSLAERILDEEHVAFPKAIRLFFQERLSIDGRVVLILDETSALTQPPHNPGAQ
jgi:phosphoribosylglycinamide formyltransferase-1